MSQFLENILKLVSASVMAQVIGFFLLPIVSRLYPPADFGIFQLFLAISAVIVIVSPLSYQFAIVLPEKDEEAVAIFVLSLLLVFVVSCVTGAVVLLFREEIAHFFDLPAVSDYLVLLPLFVILNSTFAVMNYWMTRRTYFGVIAGSKITNSIATKAVQIGFGVMSPSPLGLITGAVIAYALTILYMLRGIRRDLVLLRGVTVHKIREMAVRYRRFPIYASWSSIANETSVQVAPFMLALFFDPTTLGYYFLATQAVNVPMLLIGYSTSQVFFQKVNEHRIRNGSVKLFVGQVYRRLISIGIFPIVVLLFVAEELFVFVFGANWYLAGVYCKILSPWVYLVFLSFPLANLFSVFEKQDVSLTFNIAILASRIVSLYIGGITGDPLVALALFSGTGVIFYGWMNYYLLTLAEVPVRECGGVILKFLSIALLVASPLLAVSYMTVTLPPLLLTCVVVTVLYYLIVLADDGVLRNQCMDLVKLALSRS